MPSRVIFRPRALRDLDRLPPDVRRRVVEKLEWYASQAEPLNFAHHLTDHALGDYRYRIGDWRIIFDFEDSNIVVLAIDRRDKAYR